MSPELQRAYDALQQADEAGNTEDAQQIADYIRELEAQQKQGNMIAPITGVAVGTTAGATIAPKVGAGVDIVATKAAEKVAGPKGTPRGDKVAKWLATQTTGPNVGGATFEEAYKKSEIARGKPVQSRGSQIPMRRGALGITNQPEPPSLPQQAAANIIGGEKLGTPGVARRVAGMGVAGAEAGKMISDIERGDPLAAIISGIGAAGGAMSQSRIKPIRAIGTGLSALVPAVQGAGAVKDIVSPSVLEEEEKEKKAHGGLVHLAKGGKAINEALELVKKTLQSGKSGKQLARESEYVHTITPTHQFSQPKKLSIQDLQKQNAVLIGVPGDRSLTGQMVHQVNDVPLTKPVEQFGGPLYGLQQADLGQQNFWASQKGAASGMQNKAARAMQEHDRPVFGIYAAMAPDSSNYALHHIETLLNQVPAMNPAKSQVKQFDKMVREKYPAFAGIMDPDLIEQLKNDSKLRKFIADRMNKTTVADLYGLPSGEATLHAITEPALRDVATGTTGFAVGKLDPFAKLTPSKHPTYSTNIPGEFQGQMIAQLPWDVYFPDVAKKIAANPKQAEHAWGTFKMGEFNQPVTQELVDRIAPIEEVILDLKKKKAAGGSIQEYAKGKRVISAAKDLILPPAENAARTQIIGTLPTYAKAAEILKQRGAAGRGIDVGAGLGEGSKILGPNFDTMEPYAKNWKPTFTSAEQMPSDAYGQLTNLNVMNVMPREARDELVQHMGRTMEPGGLGILTTRGADVMKAQGHPGPEPMSMITSRDTYQKGFTKQELEDYLRYMLGDKFDVNKINLGPAGAIIQKKAGGGKIGTLESLAKKILPAAEREANKAKFLENSVIKDRLFHGTTNDITSFSPTEATKKTGNVTSHFGTFLSDNPKEASRYATDWGTSGGNVMPVHVQLQNPYKMPYKEFDNFAMGIWNRRMADPDYDPKLIVKFGDMKAQRKAAEALEKHREAAVQDVLKRKQELIDQGHDGIVVKIGGNTEIIPFESNKIKSAIGNIGTFNPLDPDITKKEGGSTTPAWQRKEGKNPEGGLNALGRASYNRETGGNLKAPQPEGGSRKKSFCARMGGMKKKLTSAKTANDPDSRINKALRKWKC